MLQLLQAGELEKIKANLPAVAQMYPDNPVVLYLQGWTEPDAEKSLDYYERLLETSPNSDYADDAQFRIAQYYFARGLYHTARGSFLNIARSYANSNYRDKARYLAAQCLLAVNEVDSAKVELEELLRDHPDSTIAAAAREDLLEKDQPIPQAEKSAVVTSSSGEAAYAIQIGAYRERNNAVRQQRVFSQMGYPVRISEKHDGQGILYLVWVGNCRDANEANTLGQEFQKKFGLPFRVVNTTESR